jgi:hypothetical protein
VCVVPCVHVCVCVCMGKVPGINGDEYSRDPDGGGQSSPTIVLVLCVSGSRDLASGEWGVIQLWGQDIM